MRLPTLAVVVSAAVAALTACDPSPTYVSQPVAAPVLQQCVKYYPDGTAEVVDDDYCEDGGNWYYGGHYYPHTWYYGGSTYRSGNHYYVRSGNRSRPVNVVITVRDARYGGSPRTQGYARSYNEGVRKTLGTTPTYQARSGYGSTAVKSSDDRRTSFSRSTSTGSTTRSTTRK